MEGRASLLVWFRPKEKQALDQIKETTGKTWRELLLDTYEIPYDPIPLGRPVKN